MRKPSARVIASGFAACGSRERTGQAVLDLLGSPQSHDGEPRMPLDALGYASADARRGFATPSG